MKSIYACGGETRSATLDPTNRCFANGRRINTAARAAQVNQRLASKPMARSRAARRSAQRNGQRATAETQSWSTFGRARNQFVTHELAPRPISGAIAPRVTTPTHVAQAALG